MKAGKPQPNSLAIAYSVKRQAKKKMAQGGEIKAASSMPDEDSKDPREMGMLKSAPVKGKQELHTNDESMSSNSIDQAKRKREMIMLAEGGEVDARSESMSSNSVDDASDQRNKDMLMGMKMRHAQELRAASGMPDAGDSDGTEMAMLAEGGMVDAIMKKRKMMASGGEVDLQANADEDLNNEDDLSFDAARKKTYFDDSQMDDQPEDSNEKGDDLDDADSHDLVGSIRKKMKSRK